MTSVPQDSFSDGRVIGSTLLLTCLAAGATAWLGGTGGGVAAAAAFALPVAYLGLRIQQSMTGAAAFDHRAKWVLGWALTLGGPVAAVSLFSVDDGLADTSSAVRTPVVVALVAAYIAWSSAPARGFGWTQRATAWANRSELCPACGMAASLQRHRCDYCSEPLPDVDRLAQRIAERRERREQKRRESQRPDDRSRRGDQTPGRVTPRGARQGKRRRPR